MSQAEHHQPPAYSDIGAFGFWLYMLTDLLVFAVLFATFVVLRNNVAGGPSAQDIFDLPFILVETVVLLTSSLTSGLGMLAVYRRQTRRALVYFVATFALGATFLGMELYEFNHLIHQGYTWQTSGFLSAYYALVGTHGLHIAVGLLWLAVLLAYTFKRGLTNSVVRKYGLLSIFWHFLDLVWIFVFTIVYLMGVAQ